MRPIVALGPLLLLCFAAATHAPDYWKGHLTDPEPGLTILSSSETESFAGAQQSDTERSVRIAGRITPHSGAVGQSHSTSGGRRRSRSDEAGVSVLWGEHGELWEGPGGRLPDFSRCGYRVQPHRLLPAPAS